MHRFDQPADFLKMLIAEYTGWCEFEGMTAAVNQPRANFLFNKFKRLSRITHHTHVTGTRHDRVKCG